MARSIRVFSGNLWYGQADSDALVDLIREYQVDVFAAQELGHENAEAISSELRFGCLSPSSDAVGMGVALRHPASHEPIPLHHRSAHRVVLDPASWRGLERPLEVVNVHFQAPHVLRPFPSGLVRWRQVRGLEAFFEQHPSDARAVVGDYNATPAWPLYRRMARRFSDAAVRAAQSEGRSVDPTWGPWSGSPRLFRIDHAMVRGLDVESFRVLHVPGSDHSGILFDLAPGPVAGRAEAPVVD